MPGAALRHGAAQRCHRTVSTEGKAWIMARSNGYTLAVPQAALDHADHGSALVFETACWTHFTSYVGRVERLPAGFIADSAGVAPALAKLRRELQRFGSPAQLRQMLVEQAQALSGESAPAMLYGAIVWWIVHLQGTAASVLAILQGQVELVKTAADRKESLQWLGKLAGQARNQIPPLMEALNSFRLAVVAANDELADACTDAGAVLQQTQEAIGGLQVRVKNLEAQIAGLGLFGAHKKQDLLAQMHTLQKELADSLARAARLQAQLAALDAILGEGVWLDSGVGEVLDAMDHLRTAWTSFGSGMTQLAADASDAQLADPSWIEQVLDFGEAIRQWEALQLAASQFAAGALLDFGLGARKLGLRA
jgi:hypothetical protein